MASSSSPSRVSKCTPHEGKSDLRRFHARFAAGLSRSTCFMSPICFQCCHMIDATSLTTVERKRFHFPSHIAHHPIFPDLLSCPRSWRLSCSRTHLETQTRTTHSTSYFRHVRLRPSLPRPDRRNLRPPKLHHRSRRRGPRHPQRQARLPPRIRRLPTCAPSTPSTTRRISVSPPSPSSSPRPASCCSPMTANSTTTTISPTSFPSSPPTERRSPFATCSTIPPAYKTTAT